MEGAELLVLSTLNWAALSVGIMIVECASVHCASTKDNAVRAALLSVGLQPLATVKVRGDIANMAYVNASAQWAGSWHF